MRIIFLRHGQDDDTRRGGWSQYGLLEEGHVQAQKVANYFQNQASYQIGAVYASDLNRTMETAVYAAQALNLPIRKEPRLREINNGLLAGMPNAEALKNYPGLFFSSLEMDESYPGGESPSEFYSRIKAWLESFLEQNRKQNEDILVITHGGVIKVIYHLAKKLEWTNKNNTIPTEKCSIHVLDTNTMEWEAENMVVWQ